MRAPTSPGPHPGDHAAARRSRTAAAARRVERLGARSHARHGVARQAARAGRARPHRPGRRREGADIRHECRLYGADRVDLPGAELLPLDRLLATSDVVSLHCPLTPETRHLIDKKALAKMKRSAYLINTSRGPVVDEAALAWALNQRLIAGAALDVYEKEPAVHPDLLSLENVMLIPHIASATTETRTAMADLAVRTRWRCSPASRRSTRYDSRDRRAGRRAVVSRQLSSRESCTRSPARSTAWTCRRSRRSPASTPRIRFAS